MDYQITSLFFCLSVSFGRMLGQPCLDLACITSTSIGLHTGIFRPPEGKHLDVSARYVTLAGWVVPPMHAKSHSNTLSSSRCGSAGLMSVSPSPWSYPVSRDAPLNPVMRGGTLFVPELALYSVVLLRPIIKGRTHGSVYFKLTIILDRFKDQLRIFKIVDCDAKFHIFRRIYVNPSVFFEPFVVVSSRKVDMSSSSRLRLPYPPMVRLQELNEGGPVGAMSRYPTAVSGSKNSSTLRAKFTKLI